jgi:SAM-dependent methyltransferase
MPDVSPESPGVIPSRGVIPSPNIWGSPDDYKLENEAVDRAQVIESAMRTIHDWATLDVADIGCGTGFHLPVFAATARRVVGVEPHPPLAARARARAAGLATVSVVQAGAAATGLPAASVDVAHARWAYFFGPGCEPGLSELARIIRPGGTAFVLDNDATRSTFGRWFHEALPAYDSRAVERFWQRRGWSREQLDVAWTFDSRADFEAVIAIEFPPEVATAIIAEDSERTGVDYAVNLWWRRF